MLKKIKKIIIKIAAAIFMAFTQIYRKFRPIPPRIYFCYNQSIHHIYHSIFIAIELSNIQKKYPVVILSTSKEASSIIEEELSSIPNNVKFIKIRHLGYNKKDFSINWFVFLCRLYMYKPKAVIVTDYFDNVFRQLFVKTFWIFTNHGAENRGYAHSHIKDYDLVILFSENELELIKSRIGAFNNYVISGYPKFDYFHYHKINIPDLFKNSKPVVMYNPHFEKSQSSFYDKGIELIKALSDSGKYNVIFMPHPDLTRKHPEMIDEINGLSNVVIVNRPKINLDYMAAADLYITDVSSSAFEWLYFNKPALFFYTKKNQTKNIYYPIWTFGEVVGDVPGMLKAIEDTLQHPEKFQAQRKETFEKIFYNKDKNVSKNIAGIILNKLQVI